MDKNDIGSYQREKNFNFRSNHFSFFSIFLTKFKVMKLKKYFVYFTIVILFLLAYCCKESIIYEESRLLNSDEFTFIPANPSTEQEVKMVYYGCGYNETSSVTIYNRNILVIKKFNGSMKWPCILEYDTISLGNLEKGIYDVTLKIIDINPLAEDSIFHTETMKLRIF